MTSKSMADSETGEQQLLLSRFPQTDWPEHALNKFVCYDNVHHENTQAELFKASPANFSPTQ